MLIEERKIHLLVVDDDVEIRNLLGELLNKYGFDVSLARNGEEMFQALAHATIDLIILDLMMPGDDGFTLCRKLRMESTKPIIILTAMDEETDRIIGLEIGADDYLTKPFNPRELLARIKAILRRSGAFKEFTAEEPPPAKINAVEFAGWRLVLITRTLTSPEGIEMSLSSGEYDLLEAFIEHPQKILSRDRLLEYTHNRLAGPFDRSIDVQVSRLRQKIEENPKQPTLIKTVRGGGYMFTSKVTQLYEEKA